ncbi:HET-domain-containing protein [Polychaeton citri CBS 116435]|uniref:HET-domain-containing protein n=1 Tax=Polychaeton citri CBS 116435 TaxID=1314669 RepID=A0A9P4Q0R1_9PEZI|nr:HET-domain-containing protein [Polychaeton citri CBS 116435]
MATTSSNIDSTELSEHRKKASVPDYLELRNRMAQTLERYPVSVHPRRQYIPDNELRALLTEDAILSTFGKKIAESLTVFIIKRARKVFATTLFALQQCDSREKAMMTFCKSDFTDEKLSQFSSEHLSTALDLCQKSPCKRNGGTCLHLFPYGDPWYSWELNHFRRCRWHFLLLEFHPDKFQYEIDIRQPLPFINSSCQEALDAGNFSEVRRVEMLVSNPSKTHDVAKTKFVALKTLKEINQSIYNIDREWRREANAHRELNGKHDHIIKAIAAYRQISGNGSPDKYHLVLEWADGGNLFNFWQNNRQPQVDGDIKRSRDRLMLILRQLCGLADALREMHKRPAVSSRRRKSNSVELSIQPNKQRRLDASDFAESRSNSVDELSKPVFNLEEPASSQSGEKAIPMLTLSTPDKVEAYAADVYHDSLHSSSSNWRHGDLKPENILRFTEGNESAWIGTLKLADLGRAQQHAVKTELRKTREKEYWRTQWYEPPDLSRDMHNQAGGKISRLFDVWSMGCIIFETVLWLIYGFDSISELRRANGMTSDGRSDSPYWTKIGHRRYEVSEAASCWMNEILDHDPERDSAIGDLIKLIKHRMLKIELPPDSEIFTEGFRTNADDVKMQLEKIIEKAEGNHCYLFTGQDRTNCGAPKIRESGMKPVSRQGPISSLASKEAGSPALLTVPGAATTISKRWDYTNMIENLWKTSTQDEFVISILADRKVPSGDADLCETCQKVDILSQQISFPTKKLKLNAEDQVCDLCTLVYSSIGDERIADEYTEKSDKVTLTRAGGSLDLHKTERKVLRLCRTDNSTYFAIKFIKLQIEASSSLGDIPLGAPTLSGTGFRNPLAEHLHDFMKLPKQWLKECDTKHRETCAQRDENTVLPKRLIDVTDPLRLKIIEPEELKMVPAKIKFIALSYIWGKMCDETVTTKQNLPRRRTKIHPGHLPPGFKNAIAITRALGHEYLWIDSLCINQGQGGDFAEQADSMQSIFSSAYCVIAACSATSATSEFLPVRESSCIKMGEVFVSPVTNDFDRDVLRSPLTKRGWVLQEHALARRTIFFAHNQLYLECGDGVRCETLARLENDEAAFLGDSNFPSYTIRAGSTRGEQIHLFVKLFKQYSRLEFSHPEDRPVAIDGLMHRLTSAFKTQSLAGLFHSFWGRCLLWQRAEGANPLKNIPAGPHTIRTPPSWSWMAFEGPISFIEPPGGGIQWNQAGVHLPFPRPTQSSWLKTSHLQDNIAIRADAYEFFIEKTLVNEAVYLSYDSGKPLSSNEVKCVIIGIETDRPGDLRERKHYTMLVSQVTQASGTDRYERVGVGCMLGKFIRPQKPVSVLIN